MFGNCFDHSYFFDNDKSLDDINTSSVNNWIRDNASSILSFRDEVKCVRDMMLDNAYQPDEMHPEFGELRWKGQGLAMVPLWLYPSKYGENVWEGYQNRVDELNFDKKKSYWYQRYKRKVMMHSVHKIPKHHFRTLSM